LKLKFDIPLSSFAFNFNLRRYDAVEEKARRVREHSQHVMAAARANQRQVEERRRAEAQRRAEVEAAARRQQAAAAAARRREHEARVAVVAERRRWLMQLLQHARDTKEGERTAAKRKKVGGRRSNPG
jgi:hypothetical protein